MQPSEMQSLHGCFLCCIIGYKRQDIHRCSGGLVVGRESKRESNRRSERSERGEDGLYSVKMDKVINICA